MIQPNQLKEARKYRFKIRAISDFMLLLYLALNHSDLPIIDIDDNPGSEVMSYVIKVKNDKDLRIRVQPNPQFGSSEFSRIELHITKTDTTQRFSVHKTLCLVNFKGTFTRNSASQRAADLRHFIARNEDVFKFVEFLDTQLKVLDL